MISCNNIFDFNSIKNQIICGDCFECVSSMPDNCIDCIVTSPPYWQQRDYGSDGQIGLEKDVIEYINRISLFFDSCKRILKKEGSMWINIGDSYNENSGGFFDNENNDNPSIGKHRLKSNKYQKNYPRRSLLMIPYRFAIQMTDKYNWLCRNMTIWHKKTTQPTTAENRFTIDFEPFFLFTQKQKYYFNYQKAKWIENRNDCFDFRKERRSVWTVDVDKKRKTGHCAVYPVELAEIPIIASCPPGGVVFDPFVGSGSTVIAAKKNGFSYIGCDINEKNCITTEESLSLIN